MVARPINDSAPSLREATVAALAARLKRLPEVTELGMSFDHERERMRQLIDGLLDGATVQLHHGDIPEPWRPPRFTWALYELRGEELVGVPTWQPGCPPPREWTVPVTAPHPDR